MYTGITRITCISNTCESLAAAHQYSLYHSISNSSLYLIPVIRDTHQLSACKQTLYAKCSYDVG